MFFPFGGGLNGDDFVDETDFEYGSYSEGQRRYIPNKFIRCNRCGTYGYMWKQTRFGWRLVYSSGKLEGKIHACESEGLK